MNEFVDPTEVERVAKLMHQSAIDWHKEHGRQEGMYVSRPWQQPFANSRNNMQDSIAHGTTQRGERNIKAKLAEADVRLIRELRKQGWTTENLATRFGVTACAIRFILNGTTWKHVK